MACKVCGRTELVQVSVERVDGRGTVEKFKLCEKHTLLGAQVPKIGGDAAMREGAKVGQELVAALEKVGQG